MGKTENPAEDEQQKKELEKKRRAKRRSKEQRQRLEDALADRALKKVLKSIRGEVVKLQRWIIQTSDTVNQMSNTRKANIKLLEKVMLDAMKVTCDINCKFPFYEPKAPENPAPGHPMGQMEVDDEIQEYLYDLLIPPPNWEIDAYEGPLAYERNCMRG